MLPLLIASVFLNGVNVDGLRGQSFEKCKNVRIDDKGDVLLECPGYQVETSAGVPAVPTAQVPALPATLTRRYWLVTEQSEGGAAQYDLDVFINSRWVRKVKAGEEQIVLEVTKYLVPGPNKVIVAATKHVEGGRRSAASSAFVKVIIGEGESGKTNVVLDNPLLECRRTAAETDNVNEQFTIQGR